MKELHNSESRDLNWLARGYSNNHYAILFYSLLATIAAGPLLAAVGLDAGILEVLLAVNLLAAVMPVPSVRGGRILFTALVVVYSLRLGGFWLGNSIVSTLSLALWSLVALFAAAGAIRFAIRASAVDREHLYAALDAYLLFGTFLGVLYWTLERTWPGSLSVAMPESVGMLPLSGAIYFSFVTLVTLGYGDILPHSEAARGVAIVEAVTGQLYLTVMIAHLVSLHVRGVKRDKGVSD